MRFRCPFCFYAINVEESNRGYSMTCPSCTKTVLVPVGRFEEGCIIGDFLIKSKIGEGSIGAVYLATQLSLDRQVALKILSPEYSTHKGINDFLNEARAAAKLVHINLVQSFAIGEEDNICYMAMTYITGETVRNRIRRQGKIPVDESLHIIQQVAEALYYAWDESHLIHRDVKPDNIMVTEDGIAKLTDLGLAIQSSELSKNMEISGSPSYMSPEQFIGEKLDTRSDIYSLGVTLYQMISGRLPFEAGTLRSVALQHFEEEALPLNKVDSSVPPRVAQLVKKMMAKNPNDRYHNMEDLLNEIWMIRQKTAPDRNLVPDIHTISIKRLDYGMQTESLENKKNVRKLENEIRERRKYLRILLFMIPVALMLGVTATLYWYGNTPVNTSVESRITQRTAYFKRFADDASLPLKVIQSEGEKILAEFGKPRNRTQKLMLDHIRAITNEAALRRAETENQNMLNSLRFERRENARLKASVEKITLRMQAAENKAVSAEEAERTKKRYQDSLAKTKALSSTIQQLESEKKQLEEGIRILRGNATEVWKNRLRLRILQYRPEQRLKEISAMLAVESIHADAERRVWLKQMEQQNDFLLRLLAEISDSGTKYSTKEIPGFGGIVMISCGYVDYHDEEGQIRQVPWHAVPTEKIYTLIAGEQTFRNRERETKAGIELLKGNLGKAQQFNSSDVETAAMIQLLYRETSDTIKYMATENPSAAAKLAEAALIRLAGASDFDSIQRSFASILRK